jgi:SAM-dependent methyltransferase
MSDRDPQRFYDDLAELFHLVYADWERSIGLQGSQLAGLLRQRWRPMERVLDAACGIGTQALGLAAAGLRVTASDLSPRAVDRARREARRRGLAIAFAEADLRSLTAVHPPGFDAVLACDNAIPHLLSREEIRAAFGQMRAVLRPGGGCLVSVRDYAEVERSGTRLVPYGVRQTDEGRVIVFQVWDFYDAEHYDLAFYFVRDADPPQARVLRTRYHAIGIPALEELLRQAGFSAVEVLREAFFQPLLVATNPG